MDQTIININNNYEEIKEYILKKSINSAFIVCSNSLKNMNIGKFIKTLDLDLYYFTDFEPNPTYDSVINGVKKFNETNSDMIIAIGGGSAIDVAKCIKLFHNMNSNKNYLDQHYIENDLELMAVPTTAGTGSEATKFAVIYYNNEKYSIENEHIIPNTVIFDSSTLNTLSLYQKKSTMLDAFSHSIESYWSINATIESKKYSLEALKMILSNKDGYLYNDSLGNSNMLKASNIAGKAINIAKTTAGHAMCYKLTSLYGISHGHAAALVNSELYPYMIEKINETSNELLDTFSSISKIFGYDDFGVSRNYIRYLLKELNLYNVDVNYNDIKLLTKSVNLNRLKNNPLKLNDKDIEIIYTRIFDRIEESKKYEYTKVLKNN